MQVGYAEHLLADLPDGSAVRVLPDAGHFLTLDAPDAVCAAVLEHLQTTTT